MIYNVKVPVVALIEAENELAAIVKLQWYLRNVTKLHVEVIEGNAFESEPLDGTEGVIR